MNCVIGNNKKYKKFSFFQFSIFLLQKIKFFFLFRCPKCGKVFALSQGLTNHTKSKKCIENISINRQDDDKEKLRENWKCKKCEFSSFSKADFIYHQTLVHVGTVTQESNQDKYRCQICKIILQKFILRDHIRMHTGERPFKCKYCSSKFTRKITLKAHEKKCHVAKQKKKEIPLKKIDQDTKDRNYICNYCNSGFHTK